MAEDDRERALEVGELLFDEIEGLPEPFCAFQGCTSSIVSDISWMKRVIEKGRFLVEEGEVPGLVSQIQQEVGTRPSPPPVEDIGRSRQRSALDVRA